MSTMFFIFEKEVKISKQYLVGNNLISFKLIEIVAIEYGSTGSGKNSIITYYCELIKEKYQLIKSEMGYWFKKAAILSAYANRFYITKEFYSHCFKTNIIDKFTTNINVNWSNITKTHVFVHIYLKNRAKTNKFAVF